MLSPREDSKCQRTSTTTKGRAATKKCPKTTRKNQKKKQKKTTKQKGDGSIMSLSLFLPLSHSLLTQWKSKRERERERERDTTLELIQGLAWLHLISFSSLLAFIFFDSFRVATNCGRLTGSCRTLIDGLPGFTRFHWVLPSFTGFY